MSHHPLNIHAGTQIVTKVGVHGSENALVHPLGAYGAGKTVKPRNSAAFLKPLSVLTTSD
jgi:hypothetical protein